MISIRKRQRPAPQAAPNHTNAHRRDDDEEEGGSPSPAGGEDGANGKSTEASSSVFVVEKDSSPAQSLPFRGLRTRVRVFAMAIGAVVVVFDLLLTVARKTYPVSGSLPLMQRLVYTPGGRDGRGSYAQNYQDTWILGLVRHNDGFVSKSFKEGSTDVSGRRNNTEGGVVANYDDGAIVGNDGGRPGGRSASEPLFFLDIGAYHGLWCSNSYLLEKYHNWEGVCVEPFPEGFERRRCQLFANAMSDTDGVEVDFSGAGQERAISTTVRDGAVRSSKSWLVTETISFPSLLERSNAPSFIAFVSLDVEGHEYAVLQKFPFDSYAVGAWVVEGHDASVRRLLGSHGYKRRNVRNGGVDEYFVRDEFWDENGSVGGSGLQEKEWRVHPFGSWGC